MYTAGGALCCGIGCVSLLPARILRSKVSPKPSLFEGLARPHVPDSDLYDVKVLVWFWSIRNFLFFALRLSVDIGQGYSAPRFETLSSLWKTSGGKPYQICCPNCCHLNSYADTPAIRFPAVVRTSNVVSIEYSSSGKWEFAITCMAEWVCRIWVLEEKLRLASLLWALVKDTVHPARGL